jgi:hypothetical protein
LCLQQNDDQYNNNKLRWKIIVRHKLANDKGALTMMCGRDEKPWSSAIPPLNNCYGLHTFQGYEHVLSIIRNKHQGD